MVGNFSLASDLSAPDVIDFLKAMSKIKNGTIIYLISDEVLHKCFNFKINRI